ncbi:MAG: hypothetical protein P1U57_09365 [Oleibacter sp.]|nr:hypothetical protein [Thalassolituus sp.]
MKKFLIATLGAALFLGGCATGSGGENGEKVRLYTSKLSAMAGKKEVYIGHLGVTFITEDKSTSKSSSPMVRHDGPSAQATLTAKLSGVPEATMQAIADETYANLVADLEAKGYTVKNYSDLRAQKPWQKMKTFETPYTPSKVAGFLKKVNTNTVAFAPSNMDLLFDQSKGMDAINNNAKLGEITYALNTPIISADYTVHFAYFDNDSDYTINYGISQTASASVDLGQGIQAVSGSGISILTEGKNPVITLKDPIIVSGVYGRNEDTTSGASKFANSFNSVVSMFGGTKMSSKEISIVAEPEYFKQGVLKALSAANERIVNKLATAQ